MATTRFWQLDNLAKVTNGRWLDAPEDRSLNVNGVSIDTRTLHTGNAYVAIRGKRVDGHDFVQAAIKAGAALAIVSHDYKPEGLSKSIPILTVKDGVEALQVLASKYRSVLGRSGVKVIAVTGSNGKTTTRQMIHTLLSAISRGTQSPKSFNNHIGVPLTLLAASTTDDFVVVEIGTNHPGEIDALSHIVRPDIGVITTIGPAHLEGLGTVENVAAEKAALLKHVKQTALVTDTPPASTLLQPFIEEADINIARFGSADTSDVHIAQVETARDGLRVHITGSGSFTLPLLGRHNAMNFAAAWGVAREIHKDSANADTLHAAVQGLTPGEGRMEEKRFGNLRIIHDAYNANPDSAKAVLTTLVEIEAQRRILILGDMLELGDAAEHEHLKLGKLIAKANNINHVVLIGNECRTAQNPLSKATISHDWYETLDNGEARQIAQYVADNAKTCNGDVVVALKGSRGLKLERIIEALYEIRDTASMSAS